MSDKKRQSEWDAKQFLEAYEPMVEAYLTVPENIADMPSRLLTEYKVKSLEKDTHDKRLWVVKRYRDGAMGFSKYVRESAPHSSNRAKREAELLMELDHPAIPKVMDYWDCERGCCLVREYFEGRPLHVELAKRHKDGRGYFSVAEALDLALRIGNVLVYLGAQPLPVVHRDIKPQNIILTPEGEYKLVDFDVARRYDPTKLHDTTLGKSEGFTAPEQYGYSQSTPSADRHSLGKTLLYMTTGTSDIASGLAQIEDAGLKHLIQKCCEFAPAERFSSIEAMMRCIGYLQEGFVPLGDQAKMQGSTLEAYAGKDRKLFLQGVSHIADDAFQSSVSDAIEEMLLSSLFSPNAIPALGMLKNLACVSVEDENPELASFDGLIYSKDYSRLLFFPVGKRGTWSIPAQLKSIDDSAWQALYEARFIEEVEVEPHNQNFTTLNGVLFTHGHSELLYCPRKKSGVASIPIYTFNIHPKAFWGCTELTDIELPEDFWMQMAEEQQAPTRISNLKSTFKHKPASMRYGDHLCRLFEGCNGLPERFQHQWQDYCAHYPIGREAKCIQCGEIRDITHWNPPAFGHGALSPYLSGENICEDNSLIATKDKRWRTTGKIIEAREMHSWLAEWDQGNDEIYWKINPFMKLEQMVWDSEEIIHSGVTRGTEGGWMEVGAEVDGTAWLDPYTLVFAGAKVLGQARISGGARIESGAVVFDHAIVDEKATIGKGAFIFGRAHVSGGSYHGKRGRVLICGDAHINGNATIIAQDGDVKIHNNASIHGSPCIQGSVTVGGSALIKGCPEISGAVQIGGSAMVFDHATVSGNVIISGKAQVGGHSHLEAHGTKIVETRTMPDSQWDDFNEDTDWRYNDYGTTEQVEQPYQIRIAGNAKIIGAAYLFGDAVYEANEIVDSDMDLDSICFTRKLFDDNLKKWVDELSSATAPSSILHKLEFRIPAVAGNCYAEILMKDQLADYLAIIQSSNLTSEKADAPYPPEIYRNGHKLNQGSDYEIVHHVSEAHIDESESYTVKMTGLLKKVREGDSISIRYRALMDTRRLLQEPSIGSSQYLIAGSAKLRINGRDITANASPLPE